MNLRQLAYGILSFVPGVPESLYKGTGGTNSAEYSYCIWLRHLVLAHETGMPTIPQNVAELGPGDSIGVGIAALLCGTRRYIALDAVAHADTATNLRVFDKLVELFRGQAPIPDSSQFPEIKPDLHDHTFPKSILTSDQMHRALAADRVAWLRSLVSGEQRDSTVLDYRAPWDHINDADAESVDFILTNAVMEHVADLPSAYAAMHRWLRPGGYASNQIDFRSHALFHAWDGHWGCPEWLWRLFVGRRSYLLNRAPLSVHRKIAEHSGFRECRCARLECAPSTRHFATRFQNMDALDRHSAGAYLLLQKQENSEIDHVAT